MSGMQRFWEVLKSFFVSREEAESILNKTERILSGDAGNLNSVGDGRTIGDSYISGLSSFLHNGGKVKRVEIYDSDWVLGISAVVINDGELRNCCTRCGRVTNAGSSSYSIDVNVTKAMGVSAHCIIYCEE